MAEYVDREALRNALYDADAITFKGLEILNTFPAVAGVTVQQWIPVSDILRREFSNEFIAKMKNAIEVSHYKYGWMSDTYPELAQAYKCIRERLELYEKTHNTEYLIDIANFAMIEYKFPAFDDAKYTPTDSDQSPGLAGGISYKELMELGEE